MAYVPSQKNNDDITNVRRNEPVKKEVPKKAPEEETTKIKLSKGQVVLYNAGVAALFGVSCLTLVGSMNGVVDIIGLATHPEVYGIGEWISFGIPAAANVFVASKAVPAFMKNFAPTASIYDGLKAVKDSWKGGRNSFVEVDKENEGKTRK